jgi:glycosyltransferase involved in cell wall biosynthesis
MTQPLKSAAPSPPRASVVIPTYRRTDELRALLDTLLPETGAASHIEVIVSDDGSGVEVAEMAAAYASRFPRFKYVAAAAADVLLFVDSDCLVEPGWADALASAIEAGASIAFGPTRSPVPSLEPFVHAIFFENELVGATNMAFARRTYEALGGFRPEISRFAEDRDLFTRARAAGHVPLRVAGAVVNHPPRPKKIRLAPILGDAPYLKDLRAFYSSHPDVRDQALQSNRALLAKGVLKLLVGMTPVGLPTFVAHALLRRRDVNRCLAAANVDFRVPAGEAIKYGLLQPVNDVLHWALHALQMSTL